MNDSDHEMLLSAYLDDEVTGKERAQVEQLLVENAEFRRLHRELVALRQRLHGLPKAKLDADFARRVVTMARVRAAETERTHGNSIPVVAETKTPNAAENSTDDLPSTKHAGQGDDAPSPVSISIPSHRKMPGWYWQLSAAAAAIGLLVVIPVVLNRANRPIVSIVKGAKELDAAHGAPASSVMMQRSGSSVPPGGFAESHLEQRAVDDSPSAGFQAGVGGPAGGAVGGMSGMGGGQAPSGRTGNYAFPSSAEGIVYEVPARSDYLYSRHTHYYVDSAEKAILSVLAEAQASERRADSKRQLESLSSRQEEDGLASSENRSKDQLEEGEPQDNDSPKDTNTRKSRRGMRDTSGKEELLGDRKQLEDIAFRAEVWQAVPLSFDSPSTESFSAVPPGGPRSNLATQDEKGMNQEGAENAPSANHFSDFNEPGAELKAKEAESGKKGDGSTPAGAAKELPLDTIESVAASPDADSYVLKNGALGELDDAKILLVDMDAPEAQPLIEYFKTRYHVTKSFVVQPGSEGMREMTRSTGVVKSESEFDSPGAKERLQETAEENVSQPKGEVGNVSRSRRGDENESQTDRPPVPPREVPGVKGPVVEEPSALPPKRKMAPDDKGADTDKVDISNKADTELAEVKPSDASDREPSDREAGAANGQGMAELSFSSRLAENGRAYWREFRWQRGRGLDKFREQESGEQESREQGNRTGEMADALTPRDAPAFGMGVDKDNADGESSTPAVGKKLSSKKSQSRGSETPTEMAADAQVKGKAETSAGAMAGKPGVAKPDMPKPDDASMPLPAPAAGPPPPPASAPASKPGVSDSRDDMKRESVKKDNLKEENAKKVAEKFAKGAELKKSLGNESMQNEAKQKVDPAPASRAAAPVEREEMATERAKSQDDVDNLRLRRFGAQAANRPRWLVIVVPNSSRESGEKLGLDAAKEKTPAGSGESPNPATKAEPASPEPTPAGEK